MAPDAAWEMFKTVAGNSHWFEAVMRHFGIVANADSVASFVQASAEGTPASGGGVSVVCEVVGEGKEAVIDEGCIKDGFIGGLQSAGIKNPTNAAIEMGLYDPDERHGNDPHHPESAVAKVGDRIVANPDGSVDVFRKDPKTGEWTKIAAMDCEGKVTQKYTGPMMNTTPCELGDDDKDAGYPKINEPVQTIPPAPPVGQEVMSLKTTWCYVDENGNLVTVSGFKNFLKFDSIEEARAFFTDPKNHEMAKQFFAELKSDGNAVYITDGVGSVQTICFELDTRGNPIMVDGVPVLSGEVTTTTFNEGGVKHMSEKTFERYLKGFGKPGDVDDKFLGQRTRDVITLGSVQEARFDPITNTWEYVDPTDNPIMTEDKMIRTVIEASELSVKDYAQIMESALPAEFFDETKDIGDRAKALQKLADQQGITLSDQGAENMARFLSESFDGKVPYQSGVTLRNAVSTVAQSNIEGIRKFQGL